MTRNSLGRLAIAAFVLFALASCERYSVPLLVPPDTSGGQEGVLRILNVADASGSAEISSIGAFNRRFVDQPISTRSASSGFALTVMAGERFTQTDESGVNTTTNPGSYDYEIIGPDAGRLTLDYDSGDECRMNLYFTARTTGWIASNCTEVDFPVERGRGSFLSRLPASASGSTTRPSTVASTTSRRLTKATAFGASTASRAAVSRTS